MTILYVQFALYLILILGIGYFGLPHILTRFIGIKNIQSVKSARRISIS